jgi:hypothetical protein
MSSSVVSHLGTKFAALQQYFQNIDFDDLKNVSEENLLGAVPQEHKLLMRVFINQKLLPYLNIADPYASKLPPKEALPGKKILDLKERVLSHLYPKLRLVGKFPITMIQEECKESLKNLDVLDLSCNHLNDVDLPIIAELVQKYHPKVVDLSLNTFWGYQIHSQYLVDKALKSLLSSAKYVNIVGNPLATVDRKDLFQSLTEDQLSRLIWIPKCWVEGGSWKNMIRPESHELVRSTHEQYFKEYQ